MLGYTKTGGNTDNSAGNFLFHAAHVMGDWKLPLGIDGLYGSTHGETTAQAWDAYLQANYYITSRPLRCSRARRTLSPTRASRCR